MNQSPSQEKKKTSYKSKLEDLCPLQSQTVQTPESPLTVWSVNDPDPLLEELSQRPDNDPDLLDERMPYWGDIWPSSVVLAEVIRQRSRTLPDGPWLELGCGPGLPGLMAASAGVHGIATDYMTQAGWLVQLNAIENGLQESVSFKMVDWRSPPQNLKVPWILASDIVYEKRNFDPLLNCFDQLLSPKGEVWLAEPGRPIARPFFHALDAMDWQREIIESRDGIIIHRCRRAADVERLPHK